MNIRFSKSIDSLKSKSNSIINVFTTTVQKLEKVNSRIEVEVEKDKEELEELNREIKEKEILKISNSKIINKIKNFLED